MIKNRDGLSELDKAMLIINREGLLNSTEGHVARVLYEKGVLENDKFLCGLVMRTANGCHRQLSMRVEPFRPAPQSKGELFDGHSIEGLELRSRIEHRSAHAGILGSSGCGKSNLMQHQALEISPHVPSMWLFDCQKREFSRIMPLLNQYGNTATIIPRNACINPISVPWGVEVEAWIPYLTDIIVSVCQVPPGRSTKILRIATQREFDKRKLSGLIADDAECPIVRDIYDAVHNAKNVNAAAREALLDSLGAVLSSIGNALNYRIGWPIHELTKRKINWVLTGSTTPVQNLFVLYPLMAEFASRIARGVTLKQPSLEVFLDEGQRLLSQDNPHTSLITQYLALIRGAGLYLTWTAPTSHRLLPDAMSVSATRWIGRCNSFSDYDLFARSMGLSREQVEWITHNLRPGLFVRQVGEQASGARYPHVVEVPLLKLPPVTTFDDSLGDLASLPVLSADPERSSKVSTRESTNTPTVIELDEGAYRLCKAIADRPLLKSSVYRKLAGLGAARATRLRKQLIKDGLIRVREVDGLVGRSSLLLELTKQGLAAVKTYEAHKVR